MQVCLEQKALPTAERPTCCSGREQRYAPAHTGDAISSSVPVLLERSALEQRRALRTQARQQRAALSSFQRRDAARRIAFHVAHSAPFRNAGRIALYMATGMEPDLGPLLSLAARLGKQVYLPRIHDYRQKRMELHRHGIGPLRLNRHGIAEPPATAPLRLHATDLVLVPTLAFRRDGARLGSGGGYYDRWLGRLRTGTGRTALIVGIAYACNEAPLLRAAPHDLRLDRVVTERGWIICHRREHS